MVLNSRGTPPASRIAPPTRREVAQVHVPGHELHEEFTTATMGLPKSSSVSRSRAQRAGADVEGTLGRPARAIGGASWTPRRVAAGLRVSPVILLPPTMPVTSDPTDPVPCSTTHWAASVARHRRVYEAERGELLAHAPALLALAGHGIAGFWQGVPMHWMRDWSIPYRSLVESAHGAVLTTSTATEYADFASRHGLDVRPSPPRSRGGGAAGRAAGSPTCCRPRTRSRWDACLAERFGLPQWQLATTATDANRFALRVARAVTGRPKILVFNGCYHGTVDETFVRLVDGQPANRPGMLGQFADLTGLASVVEFNDLAALEAALAPRRRGLRDRRAGDDQFLHGAARARLPRRAAAADAVGGHAACSSTRRTPISTGPGGYTRAHGLEPTCS